MALRVSLSAPLLYLHHNKEEDAKGTPAIQPHGRIDFIGRLRCQEFFLSVSWNVSISLLLRPRKEFTCRYTHTGLHLSHSQPFPFTRFIALFMSLSVAASRGQFSETVEGMKRVTIRNSLTRGGSSILSGAAEEGKEIKTWPGWLGRRLIID